MTETVIHWFRQDLRLADNRALAAACETGRAVIPVYILDDAAAGEWRPGGASRWWLHESLSKLAATIESKGGRLILRRGATADVLAELARETGARTVFCSRAYEPWARRLEEAAKAALERQGVALKRYAGALLREPEEVRNGSGQPYRVYTPFWRALTGDGYAPAPPRPAPKRIAEPERWPESEALADWKLQPVKPDWAKGFRDHWTPGEAGAAKRLDWFIETAVSRYKSDRDRPDGDGTSRLSPHLHFGEISPATCWHATMGAALARTDLGPGPETFLREIAWREFSYHLLFHWPDLPAEPFRPEFAAFPWREDRALLRAWQRGRTGYPIVDAGMRQLWATGWMHNRVRMIVASFLIKDLMIPWQEGERWFWDTLVDADLASNAASWQWVAGSGADAAPYFRIFNPVTQGQKFDPQGDYVRRWVPELARLAADVIHAPWLAKPSELHVAGVELGRDYPRPVVDHKTARERALAAFAALKGADGRTGEGSEAQPS